jgi:membrane protease YdiL (CAAX protease family)
MNQSLTYKLGTSTTTEQFQKILFIAIVAIMNLDGTLQFDLFDQLAISLFLVIILSLRAWNIIHFGLLFLIASLNSIYLPRAIWSLPAIPFLVPFTISTAIILPFSRTRPTLAWAKAGMIDKISFLLLFVTGMLSTGALIVWALWTDNLGIGAQMVEGFSQYPKWLILVFGIPLFAIVNAFAEEVVYRGVMQEALSRVFKQRSLVLILQASAFAAIHFAVGFPNGFLGYLMVFVYGFMLGYLRVRTNGMLAPYLAHVIADLAIGYFLCLHAL